jgi:UDP-N-acetylmuramate dehydrogenase
MTPRSPETVVLAALLRLEHSNPATIQEKFDEYVTHRRRTQPPGASMGSMFKNPPGDYAGRLIEAAGLKDTRIGDAQISSLHANFFINLGQASALDIYRLIRLARQTVVEKFGVDLELEVELVGDWSTEQTTDKDG